jgi:endonuclease YncB( thermonuclease family)
MQLVPRTAASAALGQIAPMWWACGWRVEAVARGLPGFVEHPAGFLDSMRVGLFRAQCVGVIDGDTFDVVLDLGFRQYALVTLRLLGVDTPELNSEVEETRIAARAARDRASELLLGQHILVRSYKDRQTFGRYVAEMWLVSESATGNAAGVEVLELGEDPTVVWRSVAGIVLAEGLGVAIDR